MQPVIFKIEVERLKQRFTAILAENSMQLDSQMKQAIESFMQPENIERIMTEEINRTMESIIAEEVRKFYTYGSGRQVIRQVINIKLNQEHGMDDSSKARDDEKG